jgi:hypothetical protein
MGIALPGCAGASGENWIVRAGRGRLIFRPSSNGPRQVDLPADALDG